MATASLEAHRSAARVIRASRRPPERAFCRESPIAQAKQQGDPQEALQRHRDSRIAPFRCRRPRPGPIAGPAEPGHPVSEPSAREGSEALEVARARNAVGRRALLTVGGVTCRGDGRRLCQSSVAHRRSGSTATLPRRKHSRAVRLVDVAHRVALLASDYSGSAQRTRARCSCSGHARDERGGGARARFQVRRRDESCDVPWSDIAAPPSA
jgi:hypothetical protein